MKTMHTNFTGPMLTLKAPRDGALPTRFDGIAYSGEPMPSLNAVVDLATTQIEGRMPLLNEHNRDRIIGVIESARKDGGRLLVEGKLFADIPGQDGERLAEFAKRGLPLQMSMGLFNYTEDFIGRGQFATVNSRQLAGPMTVYRNGRVRECSIVAIGMDSRTSVRMFGNRAQKPSLSTAEIYRRHNSEYWR
jgi:hypothetical protein